MQTLKSSLHTGGPGCPSGASSPSSPYNFVKNDHNNKQALGSCIKYTVYAAYTNIIIIVQIIMCTVDVL